MKKNNSPRVSALALAMTSIFSSNVFAEEAKENEYLVIERIEVTAQKRIQSIQDVPIALSAFNGEELEEAGVITFQDLETVSPSLNIRSSTNESRGSSIRIRGVGTTGNNTGLEGSVGIFIDGVYLSRAGIAMNDLMDIERVEILRGPQGTLFGKNTSTGAISISTRLPDFDYEAELGLQYGSNNDQKVKGSVTGGLVEDKLAGRFSFTHHTSDGEIEDINTNISYNDKDRWTTRGQLLFTPQEDVSLRIIADYGEKDENCCASPHLQYGPTAALLEALGGTLAGADPFERKVAVNGEHYNYAKEYGTSAELNWELDSALLTAISSYRNYSYDIATDGDRSDLDLNNTSVSSEVKATTHELRLQGEKGIMNWMLGLYFFEEDIVEQSNSLYGSMLGEYVSNLAPLPAQTKAYVASTYIEGGGAVLNDFSQETDGWAIFTHNDFTLTEKLNLTAGLRYNSEKKKGSGKFTTESSSLCGHAQLGALGFLCPVDDFDSNTKYEEVTGTLKLSYSLNDDAMLFGGYSHGFKAGGINLSRDAKIYEFLPEKVDSWELGVKSEFFDNLVRTNISTYYSEFKDYQLNTYDGTSFTISNAAGVISKGIELDVTAIVSENLMIQAGYAYNDARYTNDTIDGELAGRQINSAPKNTVTLAFLYSKELTENTDVFANINGRNQSGANTGSNLAPEKYQDAYTIINARVGIRAMDDSWELALYGKNVLDEEYMNVAIDTPAQSGSLNAYIGQEASYGISATFRF